MRRRCVIVSCALAAFASSAAAQPPGIELELEARTLELGESVTVQLVCTNTGAPSTPDAVVPDGLDLKLLNPNPMSSSFTQIINGRTSQRTTFTYTLSLTALKEGTYSLGPISVTADGTKYRTEPVTIVVRKTDSGSLPRGDRTIFAEIEVDSRSLYVTETYVAKLTIGIREVQIGGRVYQVDWLRTLGGDPSQLSVFRDADWSPGEAVLVDSSGVRHRYDMLHATKVVRAEEVGTALVGPIFLKIDYPTAVRSGFFGRYEISQSRRETARADALTVGVKGPPEQGRPADYAGAIGRFTMEVTAKPTRVEQGQPVTLGVVIRGAPLDGVAGPDLANHPELASRFDYTTDELVGEREGERKVFRRAIFPRQIGDQTIPRISWSYFDPREERYVTLGSDPIHISVDPPSPTSTAITTVVEPKNGSNETTLTVLTGGIQPNFVDPEVVLADQSFTLTAPWIASLAASPVVWLVVAVITRHRARLRADVRLARRRRARREALARIGRAVRDKEPGAPNDGLAKALTTYVSDRFALPSTTLTPGEVRAILAERGVEDGLARDIITFLERCDAARYAPGTMQDEPMSPAADRVRDWIARLEGVTS